MRRAKIVASLGPATDDCETVLALVRAGVDVVRLNLSHGDRGRHERAFANVRRAGADTGRPVGILVDLQGPKVRLGRFVDAPVRIEAGHELTITTEDGAGTQTVVSTTSSSWIADVVVEDVILIDDARVRLRVLENDGVAVRTEVVVGGLLADNLVLHLPRGAAVTSIMNEKDESDLRWALHQGVDLVALPGVRTAKDVLRPHVIMAEEGRRVPVIAKIEKAQAVENLQEIIDAFDGVILARGGLGAELSVEVVPIVQKRAIEMARRWAKPVIVATQMLDSMIANSVPTRAETSDVANAVLDGADALMLSAETSVGAHPVVVVETMQRIIASTEEHGLDRIPDLGTRPHTQGGAMTHAAVEIADFVEAKYMCVFSQSGDSARRMSRLRRPTPILAFTDLPATRAQLALVWGVEPILIPRATTTDELMALLDDALLASGHVEPGERVVVTAGAPPGSAGSTNNVRVHTIGARPGE